MTDKEKIAKRQFLFDFAKWDKQSMVFAITDVLDKNFGEDTTKELLTELAENLELRSKQ